MRIKKTEGEKMSGQFFKKSLVSRAIFLIIIASFVLTGNYCSRVFASDSLRTDAAGTDALVKSGIGGELKASQDVGTVAKADPKERIAQIEVLLAKISNEYAKPGTGNLPRIALISDYHGGVGRFAQLLSDILREFSGFKGQINPAVSIEKQLNAQGLSLKTMNGAIYLNGDLLDRGKSGLACFNIAKELSETAPDKVFYISGNHDLWAFLNLSGFHLPSDKGFNFYGDTEAEKLIASKRALHPNLFDSKEATLWWTERLAKYNADQEEFQKKALDGKAADIRKKFIESYQKYTADNKWDSAQLDAMENFIGHFARIDVSDPFVGLNGLGKTSVAWWKSLQAQLIKGREARSSLGADADELSVWDEAITLAETIETQVEDRLSTALDNGYWHYRIFESINNQAYKTLEWWAKDWSSHKDWGEAVIKELNAMIKDSTNNDPLIVKDREEFKGEEVTQANYMRSHKLQDLAAFYKNRFNLGIRSPYSDLVTHSVLPIENDDVVITYKNKTYKGEAIFEVLKLISTEIKEAKDLRSTWEALNLVNSWYADMTTIAKPKNEKDLLKKIAPVLSKLGVRIWAKGHNPVNKLKVPVISKDPKDSSFAIVQLDLGMAPKFGGAGGTVILGPDGIVVHGFETDKTDENIKVSPDTIIPAKKEGDQPTVIKNPGMSAKEYLENIYVGLLGELGRLRISFTDTNAVNAALKDIVEVTNTGVKVLNVEQLRSTLIDKLVYDATFNPDKKVVALCRKLIWDIAPALGAVIESPYNQFLNKSKDTRKYSWAAINIRGMGYNTARADFASMVRNKVKYAKEEIAKSEIKYSGQRPAEYTTSILAAAIKEGYVGPIYLQGDHFQTALKDYTDDPVKAIDDTKKLMREAVEAGFRSIDLDCSPLVNWTKEDFIRSVEKIREVIEASSVEELLKMNVETNLVKNLEEGRKAIEAGQITEESLKRNILTYWKNSADKELAKIKADKTNTLDMSLVETWLGTVRKPMEYVKDVDMSQLKSWLKIARDEQQRDNAKVSAILTAYARQLEREFGLDKQGVVLDLGVEVGEIGKGLEKGKERNSIPEDIYAFNYLYKAELRILSEKAGYEILPASRIAVMTGTKHGGTRGKDGRIVKAKVSFNALNDTGKAAIEEGYAGANQHGASTLDPLYYVLFAGNPMPEGFDISKELLSEENKKGIVPVAEVHLATAYQDTTLDHSTFPAPLFYAIKRYITEKFPTKPDGDGDVEKDFIENRKNAWGPFKIQAWNIDSNSQDAIRESLSAQFDTVFKNLGVAEEVDKAADVEKVEEKEVAGKL